MPPMGPMRRGMGGPRDFLTDKEKENLPKVTVALIKRILSYLLPYTPQFLLVFVVIGVSAVLGLLPSVITGKIVDKISMGGTVLQLLNLLILAFIVLSASQIISVLERYINAWISQKIIFDMKNQMYAHLQGMSHSFFMSEKQGDIITRMNSDINGVSSVISGTLASVVSNVLTVATTLFYLFYTDWRLAIVGIIIIPLLIIPTKSVSRRRWSLLSLAQAKNDEINQHIEETLSVSGSVLTKLFTREKRERERFREINGEYTEISVREQRAGSWFHIFLGLIMEVGPLLIYFAGGFLVLTHAANDLTIGDITVVVALVNRLYFPVRMLVNLHVDFTRSLALFVRIFDYYDRPQEIVNCENPLFPDMSNVSVEFRDVKFSYDNKKPILKGVSFTLPHGKTYAIVGASGAGKSTVINLIPRLYDVTEGSVEVAGVDVRKIDLTHLRRSIGIVTQDTYLFNGTIMENLLYAKEDATREEIEQACKTANIHDFIVSLPDGYDTVVGNRGLKLSGGEKQRVSIARVLLKNPEILILDEATSSLDSISENAIQEAFDRLTVGRTCLIIAHRLSTVLGADKIMVIENGEISEFGSHDELIEKNGTYRSIYDTQFKKVIEKETAKYRESID